VFLILLMHDANMKNEICTSLSIGLTRSESLNDILLYICNMLRAHNPEPSCDFDNSPDIVRVIKSRDTETVENSTNCRDWARV
jgi:hypothetical protein